MVSRVPEASKEVSRLVEREQRHFFHRFLHDPPHVYVNQVDLVSTPRVACDKCGVKQVSPPWAWTRSAFTLLFAAVLLSMVKAMPVANVLGWRMARRIQRFSERVGLNRAAISSAFR
jgi:hypothetical protein